MSAGLKSVIAKKSLRLVEESSEICLTLVDFNLEAPGFSCLACGYQYTLFQAQRAIPRLELRTPLLPQSETEERLPEGQKPSL